MKKIILTIFCFTMLVGCTLGNTPTSKVEDMLTNYQMNKDSIDISYTNLTSDSNLSANIIKKYEDAIEKQYRDLSYEVVDEVIDGDSAVVTIQIEVMDYKNSINKYNREDYDINKYHEHILKELNNTKKMTTYTLDITLTKDNNDTWNIDDLTMENRNKLLGIY